MSLPASRRQLALEDLRNRLSFIKVANGYNTDAGRNIFLGEAPHWGPDDPPVGLVLSVGDDTTQQTGKMIHSRVPISIGAVCAVGVEEPLVVIEAIVADIKEAVEIERAGSADRYLGVLDGAPATQPQGLERGNTRAIGKEPGSDYVGAAVEYVASFEETWGGGGR